MEKILLAVGFRQLEEYLEKQLRKEFMFVGTTVYREGVVRAIGQKNPDIVVIRETLEGKENILTIIYEIRTKFPKIRIVFIAGKREPGDALLATLVNYGVYDVLQGDKVKAQEIISLIRKPNQYNDVKHLQPAPELDENTNKVIFKAPNLSEREVVREVIKEVYVDNGDGKPQIQKTEKTVVNDVPTTNPAPQETTKPGLLNIIKSKTEPQSSEVPFFKTNQPLGGTKQQIITFIGGRHGVGTTTVALNVAVQLAQKGLKVIYLEFNNQTPSVSYWYEIGYLEDGIDSALVGLKENNYDKIDEAIIRTTDLKEKDTMMQKNYMKLPDTLDFMFFSHNYVALGEGQYDEALAKELYLYLMFHLNYDVVILDVPCNINSEATSNALVYSNKVYFVLTQDVSSIGYALYQLNELSKKGINLSKKLYYILNKYEKSNLSLDEIEDWIESKDIILIPCHNREFVNANFMGLPVVLHTKNADLRTAFQKVQKTIY